MGQYGEWNMQRRWKKGKHGAQQRAKRPFLYCDVCFRKGEKQYWVYCDRAAGATCTKCSTRWPSTPTRNHEVAEGQVGYEGTQDQGTESAKPNGEEGDTENFGINHHLFESLDEHMQKTLLDTQKALRQKESESQQEEPSLDKLCAMARKEANIAHAAYSSQEAKHFEMQKQKNATMAKLKQIEEKMAESEGNLVRLKEERQVALQKQVEASDAFKQKQKDDEAKAFAERRLKHDQTKDVLRSNGLLPRKSNRSSSPAARQRESRSRSRGRNDEHFKGISEQDHDYLEGEEAEQYAMAAANLKKLGEAAMQRKIASRSAAANARTANANAPTSVAGMEAAAQKLHQEAARKAEEAEAATAAAAAAKTKEGLRETAQQDVGMPQL